jgi:hypothetical protein
MLAYEEYKGGEDKQRMKLLDKTKNYRQELTIHN